MTARIPREKLEEITGYKYGKAQARWFAQYLGATVPCDRIGPILTETTYESLVQRASGIRGEQPNGPRPTVRRREK